jgi:hypothetical protein
MIEVIGVILILVLVDFTARFARLAKPLRNMLDKVTEESQRIRFEFAKIAEELALIRKNLQKDSVNQEADIET